MCKDSMICVYASCCCKHHLDGLKCTELTMESSGRWPSCSFRCVESTSPPEYLSTRSPTLTLHRWGSNNSIYTWHAALPQEIHSKARCPSMVRVRQCLQPFCSVSKVSTQGLSGKMPLSFMKNARPDQGSAFGTDCLVSRMTIFWMCPDGLSTLKLSVFSRTRIEGG